MLGYLTPEAAAGDYICRRLHIPVELVGVVSGALLELTKTYNWEQFGSMTIEDATVLMLTMFNEYAESDEDCMIGALVFYITTDPPLNVLPLDGASYTRADYPILYSKLDPVFIIDPDNFVLPDFRGRAPIGEGEGTGLTARAIGDTGGVERVTLSEAEMPAHVHTEEGVGVAVSVVEGELPGLAPTGEVQNTGSTGGDGAHENMMPFGVVRIGVVAL